MTFIPDPYDVKVYQMNKNELRTSRLSKVIVLQTCMHCTYRHTYSTEIIHHAALRVVNT